MTVSPPLRALQQAAAGTCHHLAVLVLGKHLMQAGRNVSPGESDTEQGKATFPKVSLPDKNPRKGSHTFSTVLWAAGNLGSK